MKTPAYAPREPLTDRTRYARNVKKYGPAPKGWRWRQVGERYQSDDLCATNDSWYRLQSEGPIGETTYPIATPVKVLVKRDSRGRFAPEVTKKVDLGPRFSSHHAYIKYTCEQNLSAINAVLADPARNFGQIAGCFYWTATAQGHEHWDIRDKGRVALGPEDLDYLRAAKEFFEKRIVELTPPAPAPTPSPTVPELQAKISSLEAEVASLRRKIAGAKVTFPE